jgi:hypothetical protein
MQTQAADHGCSHRGRLELLGDGVGLSRMFRVFAVAWILLTGLLILARVQDSQAASREASLAPPSGV